MKIKKLKSQNMIKLKKLIKKIKIKKIKIKKIKIKKIKKLKN